ncbi:MAG: hypothetical protein JSW68_07175 [Burkholderiales bacterium]|nr:MAG: hypothetical protein JSW68_07175 [Burkholderiales bacterium]
MSGTELLDAGAWQAVLDDHAPLFTELATGTAAMLLGEDAWRSGCGSALVWQRDAAGMRAAAATWQGVEACDAELVFVAMRDALPRLAAVPATERLALLREQVRLGDMLLFVTRNCADLDAGWDDFLESLGHAFMGACR